MQVQKYFSSLCSRLSQDVTKRVRILPSESEIKILNNLLWITILVIPLLFVWFSDLDFITRPLSVLVTGILMFSLGAIGFFTPYKALFRDYPQKTREEISRSLSTYPSKNILYFIKFFGGLGMLLMGLWITSMPVQDIVHLAGNQSLEYIEISVYSGKGSAKGSSWWGQSVKYVDQYGKIQTLNIWHSGGRLLTGKRYGIWKNPNNTTILEYTEL